MKPQHDDQLFPIRILAERTGVATPTLRAWERRYGLLKPRRTPSGHRLYSGADVALVRRVTELMQDGLAIGEIAARWRNRSLEVQTEALPVSADPWQQFVDATLRAIADFSPERLESLHNEASSLYPLELVTERLIEPVLRRLGENWRERPLGIGEEHFYSAWLRNKLGARLHHAAAQARGATLVCAGIPGNHHEIGLLLFVLAAMGRGFRIIYLGPDVPLAQLPQLAERVGARAVVLAAPLGSRLNVHLQELAACVGALSCPLFLGGALTDAERSRLRGMAVVPLGDEVVLGLHLLQRHLPRADGAGT